MELCVYTIDLFLNCIGSWIRPTSPKMTIPRKFIYKQRNSPYTPLSMNFYIYRCINHNKNISSMFCYMLLCHRPNQIKKMDVAFKALYFKHFQTIPLCIGMYSGHPNHIDIEYLFRSFYRKDKKYKGFVYSRYGLWYLSDMREEELLIKFKFLYEDGGYLLTNRKKVDQLYSNYLLSHYPNKHRLAAIRKIEYTL